MAGLGSTAEQQIQDREVGLESDSVFKYLGVPGAASSLLVIFGEQGVPFVRNPFRVSFLVAGRS